MQQPLPHKTAKALRKFCLECQGGSAQAISSCEDVHCELYPFRHCTTEPVGPEERPLRSIRRHCLSCAETRADVRACEAKEVCPLWSFRFGVTPQTFKRVVARRRALKQRLLLPGF